MSFNIDEIKKIIKQVLHEKIGEKEFLYESIRQWNIEILTEILDRLKRIHYNQQIKYIVTVVIGEKSKEINFGLHTALSCLWDGTTDGCVTVKWENQYVFSIISVFGLTI
jgi:dynein light chain Tctex-type 1